MLVDRVSSRVKFDLEGGNEALNLTNEERWKLAKMQQMRTHIL